MLGGNLVTIPSVTLNNTVTLTNKTLTAPSIDNVVFPATQVSSSGVNTLDDYEEGTWTPVLTFATPGDLSVVYGDQRGDYIKIGKMVTVWFRITTTTFTHTTASGGVQISGLPFTVQNTPTMGTDGSILFQGITKVNYTHFTVRPQFNLTYMIVTGAGSGVARSDVAAADMPTGGTVHLIGTASYLATA